MKANTTVINAIDTLCDDVLSRFPLIITRLKGEQVPGGVEGDGGLNAEGWGGIE